MSHIVWDRLGNVQNYVEPFFGSGAVLLNRPTPPGIETVNDLDCLLANFWRSLAKDPEAVARHADWPVNEADLQARHQWLVNLVDFRERMKTDPECCDPLIAGWWVWGICSWIGAGWCDPSKATVDAQRPHLGAGQGVNRKRPHLGNAGRGVNRKRPHLGDAGRGPLYAYFEALSKRLRNVRVCCGDWKRVCGPTPTEKLGLTGVFLDPPYADTAGRDGNIYAEDSLTVAHEVREWAIANGGNPLLRIALCGYDGEHSMPNSWECHAWKACGGYASQGSEENRNKHRERIWFSPHCLKQQNLFGSDYAETTETH